MLKKEYLELVHKGISTRSNLKDLNDLTDRGKDPLKPWTAEKTVGIMRLIRENKVTDEIHLLELFQKYSKKSLESLTDLVYNHQLKAFGCYKYDKDIVFKYVYCCVIINSLRGNSTENKFMQWASKKNIIIRRPKNVLDEKYHVDFIEINEDIRPLSFISIKPKTFNYGYRQYIDVFAGLESISCQFNLPWKVYIHNDFDFKLLNRYSLDHAFQSVVSEAAKSYGNYQF
ncbi:MjaI family restriction endonuclease [Schleiferiaceae bacterium]|nr:MjaI family restriction endonuclease [Schleiferiaceae bacterium]MDC1225737.1 MjaI family restriction endonuclease [Schleiferiaceae bacterium]MDC1493996.1 MjaI family restriction endonuclease [Schleiferiaceae bacterium]